MRIYLLFIALLITNFSHDANAGEAYCLQFPIFHDGNSPPMESYYYYDTYQDGPAPCNDTPTVDYGWAAYGKECPQICPNCEANHPPRQPIPERVSLTGAKRSSGHQLKQRIGKDEDLKERIPDNAKVRDKNGNLQRWSPRKGVVSTKSNWVVAETEDNLKIPVKVFVINFDFSVAAKDAGIPLSTVHVTGRRTAIIGLESDIDLADPTLSGAPTIRIQNIVDSFCAEIKTSFSNQPIKVLTNTELK